MTFGMQKGDVMILIIFFIGCFMKKAVSERWCKDSSCPIRVIPEVNVSDFMTVWGPAMMCVIPISKTML